MLPSPCLGGHTKEEGIVIIPRQLSFWMDGKCFGTPHPHPQLPLFSLVLDKVGTSCSGTGLELIFPMTPEETKGRRRWGSCLFQYLPRVVKRPPSYILVSTPHYRLSLPRPTRLFRILGWAGAGVLLRDRSCAGDLCRTRASSQLHAVDTVAGAKTKYNRQSASAARFHGFPLEWGYR